MTINTKLVWEEMSVWFDGDGDDEEDGDGGGGGDGGRERECEREMKPGCGPMFACRKPIERREGVATAVNTVRLRELAKGAAVVAPPQNGGFGKMDLVELS